MQLCDNKLSSMKIWAFWDVMLSSSDEESQKVGINTWWWWWYIPSRV